jgi:MFS family permease
MSLAAQALKQRRAPTEGLARRATILSLATSMLLASLGSSVANAALPTLVQSFGTSFQAAQWIVLSYLLASTTLVVSVGRLADVAGPRRLLLIGIAAWTAASVLCAAAPTLGVLIAARAIQGGAAAVIMAVSLALVGKPGTGAKVGAAMGAVGAMSAVGTALGPSLGGFLTALAGWRAIFLAIAPVGLVAFVLAKVYLAPDTNELPRSRRGFDIPGTILLGAGLASYSLALTLGRGTLALELAAVATLVAFVATQARAADPLVPLALFRCKPIATGLATSMIVSTVLMSTLVVGPFYLAGALHLSPSQTGMILSIGPAVVALLGYASGRLTDRHGSAKVSVSGLTAIGLGCLLLGNLPITLGVPGYIVPIVFIAAGYSVFQTANNTAVMSRAEGGGSGVLSGLLNLSRNLGLITGAALMGAVYSAGTGATAPALASPEQVGHGFRTTFLVAALLIGVSLWFSARYRKPASGAQLYSS